MAKFGIGVGEEFPVDDASPRNPQPPRKDDSEERRRRRRWHVVHLLTRFVFLALIVSLIVWLFVPHGHMHDYLGHDYFGHDSFYPYHHHFFLFPWFPILLIVFLFAFARRRHGCYGPYHWHRDWHRDAHKDKAEGN